MLHVVHRKATPSIKFAGTHLYTWVERGTVRVKCLAQEHNTRSPARARTRTTCSGVERTNHEATAPPMQVRRPCVKSFCLMLSAKYKKYYYNTLCLSLQNKILHKHCYFLKLETMLMQTFRWSKQRVLGPEPRLLSPESSALTLRPPHLPLIYSLLHMKY